MLDFRACPEDDELPQLMSGQLADRDAERLEEHLLQCGGCCEKVRTLKVEDPLVAAVRGAKPSAARGPEKERVQGLIGRLQELRPMAPERTPAAVGPGNSADDVDPFETIAVEVESARARDQTDARHPPPAPSAVGEAFKFLAPALAPEDLGRLGPYRVIKVLGMGGMGVAF